MALNYKNMIAALTLPFLSACAQMPNKNDHQLNNDLNSGNQTTISVDDSPVVEASEAYCDKTLVKNITEKDVFTVMNDPSSLFSLSSVDDNFYNWDIKSRELSEERRAHYENLFSCDESNERLHFLASKLKRESNATPKEVIEMLSLIHANHKNEVLEVYNNDYFKRRANLLVNSVVNKFQGMDEGEKEQYISDVIELVDNVIDDNYSKFVTSEILNDLETIFNIGFEITGSIPEVTVDNVVIRAMITTTILRQAERQKTYDIEDLEIMRELQQREPKPDTEPDNNAFRISV